MSNHIRSQIYLYDFRRLFSLLAVTAAIGVIACSILFAGVW